MYGSHVPSLQKYPEIPLWLQTLPHGRTVLVHNPNRRPVAAHRVKAPYSAAAV